MTTTELLSNYDLLTKDGNSDIDWALWNLLKANEKHITGLIEHDPSGYYFHKSFRQNDVCPDGYTDMAIWLLLTKVTLFWTMLEENNLNY